MEHEMDSVPATRPAAVGRIRRSTSVPDMRSPEMALTAEAHAQARPKTSLAKKALDLSPLALRRLGTSTASTPTTASSAAVVISQTTGARKAVPCAPRRSLPDFLPLSPVHFNPVMNRLLKEEDPKQELAHERTVMQNASLSRTFEDAMPTSPSPVIELSTTPTLPTSLPSLYQYAVSPSQQAGLSSNMSPSSPRFLPRLSSRGSSPCPSPTRRSFTNRLAPSTPIIKTSPLDLKRPRRASSSDMDDCMPPMPKRPTPFYTSSPRGSGAASPLLLNLNGGPMSPKPFAGSGWPFSEAPLNGGALDEERRWFSANDCPSPMDLGGGDAARGRSSEPVPFVSFARSTSSSGTTLFPRALSGNSDDAGSGGGHMVFSRDDLQGSPMCMSDSESAWSVPSPRMRRISSCDNLHRPTPTPPPPPPAAEVTLPPPLPPPLPSLLSLPPPTSSSSSESGAALFLRS